MRSDRLLAGLCRSHQHRGALNGPAAAECRELGPWTKLSSAQNLMNGNFKFFWVYHKRTGRSIWLSLTEFLLTNSCNECERNVQSVIQIKMVVMMMGIQFTSSSDVYRHTTVNQPDIYMTRLAIGKVETVNVKRVQFCTRWSLFDLLFLWLGFSLIWKIKERQDDMKGKKTDNFHDNTLSKDDERENELWNRERVQIKEEKRKFK